jgi:hypothetical protein
VVLSDDILDCLRDLHKRGTVERSYYIGRCVTDAMASLAALPLDVGDFSHRALAGARHSTLLMCVAASQKPMQSASDLPPPPGLLGADSLGLPLPDEVPGERAGLGEPPPPVANWLGKGSARVGRS